MPRKIEIFRLDLSTEDVAREEPLADVSFYLDKTHIFEIGRAHQQKRDGGRNFKHRTKAPTINLSFQQIPTHTFLNAKKNLHPSAAKCVQILGTKNASGQMSLLNVRWELHKISETNSGALENKTHPPPSRFPYALCRTSPRRLGTNAIIRRSHGTQRTSGRILDGARHFKRRTAIYIYIYMYISLYI